MISTNPRIQSPNSGQPTPPALMFPPRLLLTERSSVADDGQFAAAKAEAIRIRATLVAELRKEILGYRHGGINE